MHQVWLGLAGGLFAFAGTMVDNFVAYVAQLSVTAKEKIGACATGQLLGMTTLAVVSIGVGGLLHDFPLRLAGLLAIAPWVLGWRAWRHRDDPPQETHARGPLLTFFITVALGADNVAVWIPHFRSLSSGLVAVTLLEFLLCDVIFLQLAAWVSHHPRTQRMIARGATYGVPLIYGLLGLLVLVECHTLG